MSNVVIGGDITVVETAVGGQALVVAILTKLELREES